MSNYIKSAAIVFALISMDAGAAKAQGSSPCMSHQEYVDGVGRCVDISSDDVIVLGNLKIETATDGAPLVILHDERRGDIQLILTPALVDAVSQSPAESFEAEGYLANGAMTVKNLRPIE